LSNQVFKNAAVLGALLAATAAIGGCGGGGDDGNASTTATTTPTETSSSGSGGGSAQTLKISADPSGALKFDKDRLAAKPGKVTIRMDNPSPVDHAVSILGNGVEANGTAVGRGSVSVVTADLPAGRYDFYCPVDGHKQAGMSGRLIVK
jgi:plastocyanin